MDPARCELWMGIALGLAEKALAAREVPVGCIFIRNDQIVAEGKNTVNQTKNATRHAEMNCIDEVYSQCVASGEKWSEVFKCVTVVVTVEPCIMCATALHDLGVVSIVYGCSNDRFGGCGSVLDVASVHPQPVPVVKGICAERAMALLKEFYKGTNPNAPPSKVKVKKAES